MAGKKRCRIIANDCFEVTSDQISHVDYIIMNPPFSNADKHILHVYDIAPPKCKIISLLNTRTLKNLHSESRQRLANLVGENGSREDLGEAFSSAERETDVEVSLIKIVKRGEGYEEEFHDFFMEDEAEAQTGPGVMSYNVIRDIVNRYVEAVKIFDKQLETAAQLNYLTKEFLREKIDYSVSVDRADVPVTRNNFKKELQKAGWLYLFEKMNMEKYLTKGLKDELNKFVEKQASVPFTMRNIYKMFEIVVGTNAGRMDKAILEVFESVTRHSADNQYNIEGWKTNSHYMLNQRFILNCIVSRDNKEVKPYWWSNGNFQMVEDLNKALCFLTGKNYSDMISLETFMRNKYFLIKDGAFLNDPEFEYDIKISSNKLGEWNGIETQQKKIYGSEIYERTLEWGQWTEWGFFRIKPYKKGTMHFEFLDENVWALFNQKVASLRGWNLPEQKTKTKYQQRQAGEDKQRKGYARKVA